MKLYYLKTPYHRKPGSDIKKQQLDLPHKFHVFGMVCVDGPGKRFQGAPLL